MPLPPVSAVLLDASLALPMDDLSAALQAASQYTPTSLEHGTRHFQLPPIDFLSSELFNWVDLEGTFKAAASKNGLPEDKELMSQVDGDQAIATATSAAPASGAASTTAAAPVSKKATRPEVTWLRRTEYISSLRPAAVASAVAGRDEEVKASLAEPVEFAQILAQVQQTFADCAEAPTKHPFKPTLTLEQSIPVSFDDSQPVSHCLFLGDAGKTLQERSLLQVRDLKDGSGTVATLLLPQKDDLSVYASTPDQLEFDIQRMASEESQAAGKRNFVLMLPIEEGGANALLSSINATFALRKRRKSANHQGRRRARKTTVQVSRK